MRGDSMSKFKSSLFGGYKKSDVDAEITELNKRLADAEAENKRLSREAEYAEGKAADLENKLSLLSLGADSAEPVKPVKEVVKNIPAPNNVNNGNSELFGNIAKIYERAYGVGHEIVCESKENALEMLNALSDRFDEIMGESAEIIGRYEEVNRDVQNIYVSLGRNISDISDTTSHMLKRAKEFYGIYGELKNEVLAAKENAVGLLSEYENTSSEFSAAPAEKAVSTGEVNTDTPQSNEVEELKLAVPASEEPATPAEPAEEIAEEKAEEPSLQLKVAPTPKSADRGNGEFTQFGRKSKFSSEDRNELLRKALLKNGGN